MLDPLTLRQFLTYETERTGLKLHDTIARSVTQGGQVLHIKARNMKLALMLLMLRRSRSTSGSSSPRTARVGGLNMATKDPHKNQPEREPPPPPLPPPPEVVEEAIVWIERGGKRHV